MFFVVIGGVEKISGKQGDRRRRTQHPRGWLPGLTLDDPGRELQPVPHGQLAALRRIRMRSR
jgi:hypothetical protein